MKIKNFKELSATPAREKALLIAEAGLQSIGTEKVLNGLVRFNSSSLLIGNKKFSVEKLGKIIFIGIGKSAATSGRFFEKILGKSLAAGIVFDVKKYASFKKLKAFKGSHPLPSNKNSKTTKEIIKLLKGLSGNDLVIFLISGGGSSLLCLTESGKCDQDISIAQSLMKSGATIQETNTVRKHLSLARGGWLAKYAYPANVISLVFSDVPGDNISVVASGPTFKDKTTIQDAKKVLRKYKIWDDKDAHNYGLVETPKEDKYFEKVRNILILSNKTALEAMAEKARRIGLKPHIVTNQFKGEAKKLGKKIAMEIHKAKKNEVFLYGGESTVKVQGEGHGGRNLELGLSALQYLKEDEIIITIASDGHDNGPFGGAICDSITKEAIKKSGLAAENFLGNNNTYSLFEKIGNYLMMGNTGSNVSDLVITIKF